MHQIIFMRLKRKWLIVVIVVIALFVFHSLVPKGEINYEKEEAIVTSIVDGDTIVIAGGQRVRLLNMDARERGEECYNEAKQRLEELILMKNVTMERDKENRDKYGRLLRHIYIDNQSANLILVREGLAIAYIIPPNTKYENDFKQAEQLAMNEDGCVWKNK
jgi:micrococcal nuclease